MKKPLVSVIIPTRNRQIYASKTVHQILSLKQDIEIIVQDNSDNEDLYKELKECIVQNKIKYEYEKKVLPFSENYDRATEQVTGKYLCAIGDDDGILPNITACANWMDSKGIDIVKPAKDQVYFYPGNRNKKKNACLGFGRYSGSYHYSNPESALISLLNDGGCNYLEKDLPGSYHGLVKMDAMNAVKKITGKYYAGLTPDMYSVVCLSLLPGIRFAILDYPISLPGVCPISGSAASDSGKHVGELKDAPHLKALPDYKWSEYVPQYYSVETIWAETMINAIQQMGRRELIDKYFNVEQLASYLYRNNKSHRAEIVKVLPQSLADYLFDSSGNDIKDQRSRLSSLLGNVAIKLSGKRKVIRNISAIQDAVKTIDMELKADVAKAPWEK